VLALGLGYGAFAIQPALPVGSLARLPAVRVPSFKMVQLTLRATPVEARFSIDDGPLLENPYVGEVVADGLQHRIRVEAAGHVERVRIVPFVEDVDVDIALEPHESSDDRRRAAPPARAPNARPPAAARPSQDTRGAPVERRKRELDTSNPWE
jgi:hypothetical protein